MEGKSTEASFVVYSWGANSYGQLGLGTTDDHILPQRVQSGINNNEDICVITGGGGHTASLTSAGNVYTCGWNDKGQLGLGDFENYLLLQKVEGLPKIRHAACGWNHTLLITEGGDCLSCGSNSFGQLGSGIIGGKQSKPTKVIGIPGSIKAVAAGMRHSVALNDEGQVFAWGNGKKGQIGCKGLSAGNTSKPLKVTFPPDVRISAIAAGSEHTVALSDSGSVYCWGQNHHGQCGLPCRSGPNNSTEDIIDKVIEPIKIKLPTSSKVISMHSGWSHVIARTECGKSFGWGRSDYGQLSLGKNETNAVHIPNTLDNVPRTICSLTGGSEHNLAIFDDSRLLSWGWNEHGMCGTGNEENVYEPHLVEFFADKTVTLIGCGAGTSFVLTKSET